MTTWGKNVTGWERSRLLHKLADLIERDADELAELEALNNGKPVKMARSVPVLTSLWALAVLKVASGISTLATVSNVFATTPAGPISSLDR